MRTANRSPTPVTARTVVADTLHLHSFDILGQEFDILACISAVLSEAGIVFALSVCHCLCVWPMSVYTRKKAEKSTKQKLLKRDMNMCCDKPSKCQHLGEI